MRREEMIKKLQENPAVCWILWEANNLEATFGEAGVDDGPKVMMRAALGVRDTHHMVDVVENLKGCCLLLLGLDAEEDDIWDLLEDMELILKPLEEREENQFKIE